MRKQAIVSENDQTEVNLQEPANRYHSLFEGVPVGLYITNTTGKILDVNPAMVQIFCFPNKETFLETGTPVLYVNLENRQRLLEALNRQGMVRDFESQVKRYDGQIIWIRHSARLVSDSQGKAILYEGAVTDITERKRVDEIVGRQAQEIMEMSTPVVQVWERVVLATLIGTLDSQRTQQLMEKLLQSIVDTRSLIALVDITGVPAIDTQTARHLIDTIISVRLLGAQAVLTGIRPEIAQTLVHLGIDLANVVTRSSLASGLQYALEALNLQIIPKK